MDQNEDIIRKLIESEEISVEALDRALMKKSQETLDERYTFPAFKRLAEEHKRAAKFGSQSEKNSKPCKCCMQNTEKQSFGICSRTMPKNIRKKASKEDSEHYFDLPDRFEMNSGASMFFFFVKMAILYLIIHSGIVQAYNIITNINSTQNSDAGSWITYSLVNKSSETTQIQIVEVLGLVLVVFSIFFFIFIHKLKYQIWKKIDIARQTEDDYAILVENIPIIGEQMSEKQNKTIHYKNELQYFFRLRIDEWLRNSLIWDNPSPGSIQYDYLNRLQGPDVAPDDTIKSITLCYDINLLERLRKLRVSLMQKHQKNYKKVLKQHKQTKGIIALNPDDRFKMSAKEYTQKKKRIDKLEIIPKQIKMLNHSELILCQETSMKRNFIRDATEFLGCAFISFKYQHYRDEILEAVNMHPESMIYQDSQLKITEAFHPTEVLWENLSLTSYDRNKRKFFSVFFLLMVLLFSLAVIAAIYYITQILQEQLQPMIYFQINMLSIVILIVIGYFLQILIYELVDWQRHKTVTDAKFSLVAKLVVFQFINNALIYFIVFEIKGGHFNIQKDRIGLVGQISWLLVISASLQIFFNILNIGDIYRRIIIWIYYRGKDKELSQFQITLNKSYEYVEFDIAQRYSYYIIQIFTASFYAYLVPIGIPVLVVVFFIQYWIEKLNLFKRSSMKYVVNYTLTKKIFKIFECSIVFYTVGMLIFSTKIHEQVQPIPIIAFGISALYILIANGLPTRLGKIIFQSYVELEEFDYDQNVRAGKFTSTYWRQNPFTKFLDQKLTANQFKPNHQSNKTYKSLGKSTEMKMGGRRRLEQGHLRKEQRFSTHEK